MNNLIPCPDGTMADKSIGCITAPSSVINTESSVANLILKVANGLVSVVIGLSVIFLIYGGIKYVISVGNDEKIQESKRIIFWSLLGLTTSITSYVVIQFITGIIG